MNTGVLVVGLVFLAWTRWCFQPKPEPKKVTIGQLIDKFIDEQSKK